MSSNNGISEVTVNGHTLVAGETELYVEEAFAGVTPGIYMRVEMLYEDKGDAYATFSYANAHGPELDISVEAIVNAIGSKLVFREYDSQMHD